MTSTVEAGPGFALPGERQRLILERLGRDGRVVAAALARELGTSEDTIRRDLRELAAAGRCERVYGGALRLSPASGSFAQREATAPARKAALGRRAAALVRPGQILLIDAGTTNVAVAAALPERQGLTVATNAPAVAAALLGREGFEVLLLGGRLDHRAGGAVGARTVRDLRGLRADLCFVGACAVDARAGVAAFDAEEAALKQAMVEASGGVAVAATSEKLGTAAPYLVAPVSALTDLVVEHDAPAEALNLLRACCVRVHIAGREGDA